MRSSAWSVAKFEYSPVTFFYVLYSLMLGLNTAVHAAEDSDLDIDIITTGVNTDRETTDEELWTNPGELSLVRKSIAYVDDTQRVASERFGNFMTQLDGFFSDVTDNEDAVSNGSWARIRLDARRPNGRSWEFKPSLKVRAVLPETERRLKLLVSTEEDDLVVAGNSIEGTQNLQTGGDQNGSVALRFIRTARTKGRVNLDVGFRRRDGTHQVFGRLNTGYRTDLGEVWSAGISNSYYYFSRSGFEDTLSFDFRRALWNRENFYFRSHTEFNWRNGRKGAVIGQTFGLYTQFGEPRSLALEALAAYHTSLSPDIDDRFRGVEYRIRWRHNVWRPWFFYEFWPSVSWPDDRDYRRSYGALLRVEMIIGQRS